MAESGTARKGRFGAIECPYCGSADHLHVGGCQSAADEYLHRMGAESGCWTFFGAAIAMRWRRVRIIRRWSC